MKIFTISCMLLCTILCAPAFAEDEKAENKTEYQNDCESFDDDTLGGILTSQQGCCSRHNGICGCRYGRVLCCDGTLSPTCRCLKDDTVEEVL